MVKHGLWVAGRWALARRRLAVSRAAALTLAFAALVFPAAPGIAGDMTITIQIPRLDVAEYHRPYVATWIERDDQSVAAQLAVWYLTDTKKEDGAQWLKDLRQWWRRGGRALQLPIDGVTGATRPAGEHTLTFAGSKRPLVDLAPGTYNLVVEAVREVGGRELLRVPFEWPAAQKQNVSTQGKTELGAVTLEISAN